MAASSGEHVVIIGGGATSALSAVRLAERGFRVTVLEKAQLGNGSSSRSAAGIRAQVGSASRARIAPNVKQVIIVSVCEIIRRVAQCETPLNLAVAQ